MKRRLLALAVVLFSGSQILAQQPSVRSYGFGYNRYNGTYNYVYHDTPLPTYGGFGNYGTIPQAQYQFDAPSYNYGYSRYSLPNYQYTLPSIYQGHGPFFVPYGW